MFILFDKIKSIMLLSSNFQIMSHIPLLCHHPYSPPLVLISPHSSPPSLVLSASALSRGLTTQHPSSRADHASLPMRLPSVAPSLRSVCCKLYSYSKVPRICSSSISFALENCFFPARDFSQPGCETRVRCATVIAY